MEELDHLFLAKYRAHDVEALHHRMLSITDCRPRSSETFGCQPKIRCAAVASMREFGDLVRSGLADRPVWLSPTGNLQLQRMMSSTE